MRSPSSAAQCLPRNPQIVFRLSVLSSRPFSDAALERVLDTIGHLAEGDSVTVTILRSLVRVYETDHQLYYDNSDDELIFKSSRLTFHGRVDRVTTKFVLISTCYLTVEGTVNQPNPDSLKQQQHTAPELFLPGQPNTPLGITFNISQDSIVDLQIHNRTKKLLRAALVKKDNELRKLRKDVADAKKKLAEERDSQIRELAEARGSEKRIPLVITGQPRAIIKKVKGKKYLYVRYYDDKQLKAVEQYCGPEGDPEALKKVRALEKEILKHQIVSFQKQLSEIETVEVASTLESAEFTSTPIDTGFFASQPGSAEFSKQLETENPSKEDATQPNVGQHRSDLNTNHHRWKDADFQRMATEYLKIPEKERPSASKFLDEKMGYRNSKYLKKFDDAVAAAKEKPV